MKKDQRKELRTKSKPELLKFLQEQKIELGKKKIEMSAGKLKNVSILKELKQSIARVLTILKEKEQTTL